MRLIAYRRFLWTIGLLFWLQFESPVRLGEAYSGNNYRDSDICSHWNGRRHFLELGERGDLHGRNVTTSAFRSALYTPMNITLLRNQNASNIWYQCNLELVTCAECVIRITFTHVNFSKTCERIMNASGGKPSTCPCEHINFSEPPYDTTLSGQEFCGDGKVYRSKTRTLLLKFFYRATNSHVFSLQYFSERNVKIISGSPKQSIVSNYSQVEPQIISTPYFPMPYPRDYGVEHILTCEADSCHVRIDFTDFQLGLTSTLEVFDSNGQMLDSYTGEHFRPPIIVSSGKSLLLQFRGNGVTGAGYKAEVTFVSSKQLKDNQSVPFTDCGGMVSGPGGAITMMNMIENTSDIKIYDCIWIIRPSNNYMMMKTHISLRIAEFYGMASRSNLVIRQGITSDASEIETILWPNNGLSKENHIVPILTGYYIRLQGVFGRSSKLAIAYSVFNYLSCYIGSEFLCNNNHCISVRLHCDGFDHCGDESDEPESCEEDWTHLQNDRRWYSHKPNYYFPKIDQYPDIKAATGIFIISTLGIFAVLSAWMVILYRMGVRARHQRELQNHLQTISELLDRQEELNTTDEPPDYEAPPDYEEVIKIGMDQEISECRQHQRRHCRHNHDRSRSRNTADNQCNRSIQTPLYNSEPSTSSSSNPFQKNANFRELAQRNPAATSVCDIVESCRTPFVRNYHSAASISSGSEQPSDIVEQQQHQQRNIKSPSDTRSQFEENSNEFRDESLNISFTLAIPHNTTDSDLKPGNSTKNLCNESTYLKRSFKVPRLRHTFSSPETFSNDFFKAEPLSYGTYWPNKRNSSYSNASNFGSELPPDPSPTSVYSFKQVNPVQDSLQTIAGIPTDDSVEYAAIVRPDFDSVDANSGSTINIQNQLISYFGEHGNLSSCFGNVNNRSRLSSKIRSTHTRRHVRSKSFTNCGSRQKTTKMNRSSSADFLLRSKSQKREHPPVKIYLI